MIQRYDFPYQGILLLLMVFGAVALLVATVYERRMQRHRQPGVSYWEVTLRLDGAWRRSDLFTDTGLRLQKKAAMWGMIGGISLALAVGILALGRLIP